MKIFEIIKSAFKNILSNKMRSGLTMLGLIIGIASVIVLVGIGNGASADVTSQVQSLGTDILTVSVTSSDTSLSYDQMDEIAELSNVDSVAPYKTVSATVSKGTTTSNKASIIATNENYLTVTNITIEAGRLLSVIDVENSSKVCLLGSDIADSLFDDNEDPVGATIKMNGDNYTVIGVLTAQGSSMGNNIDSTIIIPLTTATYLGSDTTISSLYVKVSDEDYIDSATTIIENYIANTLQISSDYYSVSSQDSMLNTMSDINNTLSLLLGGIASISLVVGGIGVMNVMLVSVSERTKEIGIRKSLGAKKKDILLQFLVESLVLSIIGGCIGVIFGMIVGNMADGLGYTFAPNVATILIAFFSSLAIGLIFGIFPAYKASGLNPIDALRTE